MTAPQRIYTVRLIGSPGSARLVRAPNQAQAIRHVARDPLAAEPATQDDLVELIQAGTQVEQSGRSDENLELDFNTPTTKD